MTRITSILLAAVIVALALVGAWYALREGRTPDRPDTPPTAPATDVYTIIAFGDSLTAGYGLPLAESYPAQLQSRLTALGYRARVINAGVSGETTRGNRERAAFVRQQDPDLVLLGIGGNDALRLLPLEETAANMRATIETLRSGATPPTVMLLRMQAPLNVGLPYKQQFDALYATLADAYDLELIPFITLDLFTDPSLKRDDGIHLNAKGYAKAVDDYILPAVRDAIPARWRE